MFCVGFLFFILYCLLSVDNSIIPLPINATQVSSVQCSPEVGTQWLRAGDRWAVCILSERRDGRGWLLELVLVAGSPPAAGAGDHATYSRHPPLATARTWVSKVS